MRVPQRVGEKGSLKWMQSFVTAPSRLLDKAVRESLGLGDEVSIQWLSPIKDDDYAEYRDAAWLGRLELSHLITDLRAFWPNNGPQWDGLAKTSDGKVLLFEAKAHALEMHSNCGAEDASWEKIDRSLERVKTYYGARPEADWMTSFYQYANRLAHLRFLRERGIDAHLCFVYFVNDAGMRGPSSIAEWIRAIDDCHEWLGLDRETARDGVHEVFIDVSGWMYFCPEPDEWNRVDKELLAAHKLPHRSSDGPPIPLILNGWVFSSASQKHERWQETIAWAEQRGLKRITDSVQPSALVHWDHDVPAWDPASELNADLDEDA